MNVKREHSAGFVLFHDKDGKREYLILQYPGGHFEFPKGHMEEGETELETAERELIEETSINEIEVIDGYRNIIEYSFRHAGKIIEKDVVFFLAKTNQKNVTISHEHQGSVWLPYDEAYKKLTFENAKNLLEKAESLLNQ